MKILYAGSPEQSAAVLKNLSSFDSCGSERLEIVGVLTNPPSAKGRHGDLTPTPVAAVAEELGIPVLTPAHLDSAAREQVAALNPDILVCFAYGRIFGPKFMALFEKGGINLHPSLLPKYRGCAPVQAAILACEKETGITVQRVAQEMDSGDILIQEKRVLDGTENAESFLNRVGDEGAGLLKQALDMIASGNDSGVPQKNEDATYCTMLKKEDGAIDWTMSARRIDAQIRAFYPWPLAFTQGDCNGTMTTLRIHEAAVYDGNLPDGASDAEPGTVLAADKKLGILIQTGDGVLAVKKLQWQAKKAMNSTDFMNGTRNFVGTRCTKE